MREIHLNFDVKFSPRFLRAAAVGAIVFAAVPELSSESVTLATYYPAPSGVYTNMITTGDTFLARDAGGEVRIGSSAAAPNKLSVTGNANVTGFLQIGSDAVPAQALDVAQNLALRVGNAYLSSGGDYMHLANNEMYNGGSWAGNGTPGVLLQFAGQTAYFYTHNGAGVHTGPNMQVSGGGHVVLYGGSGCTVVDYNTLGTTTCASRGFANHYVTNIAGVMAKYAMMPVYRDVGGSTATGKMLCCPCSSLAGGACPSL